MKDRFLEQQLQRKETTRENQSHQTATGEVYDMNDSDNPGHWRLPRYLSAIGSSELLLT
jgi:hypothetical protein